MKRGVLLIAGGHQQYGKMAYNLAKRIKNVSNIPIQVLTYDNCLRPVENLGLDSVFDYIDEAPYSLLCIEGMRLVGRLKCGMYFCSRFEETIFIDVDSMWFDKDINELFDSIESIRQFQTRYIIDKDSDANLDVWGSNKEAKERYDYNHNISSLSSYFTCFRKDEQNDEFFSTALAVYDDLYINKPFATYVWQNQVPDELVFMITEGICGQIGQVPFKPLYGDGDIAEHHIRLIRDTYYGITMPGEGVGNCKRIYDGLVRDFSYWTYEPKAKFRKFQHIVKL